MRTDNGTEFQSEFHWHVLDKGINHSYLKSATPLPKGKLERSHRIDDGEFYRLLDGAVIDEINIFNVPFKTWQDYYDYDRLTAASTTGHRAGDHARRPKHTTPSEADLRQRHALQRPLFEGAFFGGNNPSRRCASRNMRQSCTCPTSPELVSSTSFRDS